MNLQVNQLVITEFGYGTVTSIAPIVLPDSKRSLGSLQEGHTQSIDNREIQVKLQKIEIQQKQQEQEQNSEQVLEKISQTISELAPNFESAFCLSDSASQPPSLDSAQQPPVSDSASQPPSFESAPSSESVSQPPISESSFQPLLPESQPHVPHPQSHVPESEPLVPEPQPCVPRVRESQPRVPQPQPHVPESQPLAPESQPLAPESQPLVPESQPLVPESQPLAPESQPLLPESQPLAPESQPLLPESQPIVPALVPEYQPLLPESQPIVPALVPESQLIASDVPESPPLVPESQPLVPESQLIASDVPESPPLVPEPQSHVPEPQPHVPEPQPNVLESEPLIQESHPMEPESDSAAHPLARESESENSRDSKLPGEASLEAPKAPSLDPVMCSQVKYLSKLVAQQADREAESPNDQLPFAKVPLLSSSPPPPPSSVPNERKPPFLIKLSHLYREAIEKALQIKSSRVVEDKRMIQVKLKCDALLYTNVGEVSTHVYLLVKTFFGTRNYYLACVPIGTQIKLLIRLLSEASCENPKVLHNIRLIYPVGGLQELKDHNQTVSDFDLKNMSQLLMLTQMTFYFDPQHKGKAITLSNNNCTATKCGESDYETVLGTLAMSSGRHYWEIRVEKFVDEEDLFIGVARKEIDLYSQPTTTGMFWAYVCLCARKVGPDGQLLKYGYSVKANDTIGVLLEFHGGVGTLSFYCNGAKCGEAFNNLTGTFYPAVSMFYGEVQVALDPKAAFPMN